MTIAATESGGMRRKNENTKVRLCAACPYVGGVRMIENIDLNRLIEKAKEEQCEITITCEPARTEITIQPWEPFSYSCPYQQQEKSEQGGTI